MKKITKEKLYVIKTCATIVFVIWMIPVFIVGVAKVGVFIGSNIVANLAQEYVQANNEYEVLYIETQYSLEGHVYNAMFEVYISNEESPDFTFTLSYKPRGWWRYELIKETYTQEFSTYYLSTQKSKYN